MHHVLSVPRGAGPGGARRQGFKVVLHGDFRKHKKNTILKMHLLVSGDFLPMRESWPLPDCGADSAKELVA